MLKKSSIFLLALALALNAFSQIRNTAVNAAPLPGFRLPASINDISSLNGHLHFFLSGGILLASEESQHLASPMVDNLLIAIDPSITYAVKDPLSNGFYYTKNDSKGQLFLYYEKKPGRFASKRVKLPDFNYSVFHPVFSSDANVMFFVSDSPLGFGGFDLWFSIRDGDGWLPPQNMGHNVNTGGDEIMPAVYHNFLLFSSNGRPDTRGGFDIYASLIANPNDSSAIGKNPVSTLQAPFCSPDDDLAFTPSLSMSMGWWLRRDAKGIDNLYSFEGSLSCVMMHGSISSTLYDNVDAAYVAAAYRPNANASLRIDTVFASPDGTYTLFLRPGTDYELSFHANSHFVAHQLITPSLSDESTLYSPLLNDVRLETIALDSAISFIDLFNSSVSSELAPSGRAHLDTLARFLVENPSLSLNIYSFYNLSADIPFCSLLNASRLRTLSEYLLSQGVNRNSIITSPSTPPSSLRSNPPSTPTKISPVASSSLTVAFVFNNF